MLELMLKMNVRFTPEDRAACEPSIDRILQYAEIARAQGLLAVEDVLEREPDFFLKESLAAIVDGADPELVRKLMSYMIRASDAAGAELLNMFLCAEGVLLTQDGIHPRYIQTILGAMLGGDYLARVRAAAKG